MQSGLPIDEILPALTETLTRGRNAVLRAPPGAGKTTVVPLALRSASWLGSQRIVMLEPRRVAARASARRMAVLLHEPVGRTVGYRIRFDTQVSEATRIEVVTEGVLTRMLQRDPGLEGVGLIVFDEFHERSIHADTGLALTLQTQQLFRPDLRILVMSATLETDVVASLLGEARVLSTEGRSFPVETRYRPRGNEQHLEPAVVGAICEALETESGDILVFLPGAGEIRRVRDRLSEASLPRSVAIHTLHGALPSEEQDAAIARAASGTRKIVLATSIAETSLTIDGVRIVIDGGRMRVARFSPRTGMSRLETVRVTRASADQRRGRAGRQSPGVCFRLWAAAEDEGLVPFNTPEIVSADLAPLMLDLAVIGLPDPSSLRWLDPPPQASLDQARGLLHLLGAVNAEGHLTPHGRRMAALPLHPRLAHMMLESKRRGMGAVAAEVGALLGERDILRGPTIDVDFQLRLEALRTGRAPVGFDIDRRGLKRVQRDVVEWRKRLGMPRDATGDPNDCGLMLGFAYPDRIGQQRPRQPGRFLLANGRGASVSGSPGIAASPWIVAAELDDDGSESRVLLAAPLDEAARLELFAGRITVEDSIGWDREAQAVLATHRSRFGAIVVTERPLSSASAERVLLAMLDGIRAEGLALLSWTPEAIGARARLAFLHHWDATWPDMGDVALLATLAEWLGPFLTGMRRAGDFGRLDVATALVARLPWDFRRAMDRLAPERLAVPSGSHIAVDYSVPSKPVLAVRLQELFGWQETPFIFGGKVPLTIHLLSPAYRPVQVTQDLASFWRNSYFDVRKDLRGRYPKHHWPENPLTAVPVRGPKRRGGS